MIVRTILNKMKNNNNQNQEQSWDDENSNEDLGYSSKSDFSKPQIVQEAVNRCILYRSEEMRAGYNNVVTSSSGDTKIIYVPDTRKRFMASVEALRSLLSPEIESMEEAKAFVKEFKGRKKHCFKKYAVFRREIQGGKVIITKMLYMPELDEDIPNPVQKMFRDGSSILTYAYEKSYWNAKVKKYWDELINTYDFLFSELNKLISSKNYFKAGQTY